MQPKSPPQRVPASGTDPAQLPFAFDLAESAPALPPPVRTQIIPLLAQLLVASSQNKTQPGKNEHRQDHSAA
jgi:hypothetical protein